MAEILRCEDRWGRSIVLHDDTWYEKILMDHGEVPNDPAILGQVLRDPDRVNFDAKHASGENFYRQGLLQHTRRHRYLKVVDRFEQAIGESEGTIVSAYGTAHYQSTGERRRWGTRGN